MQGTIDDNVAHKMMDVINFFDSVLNVPEKSIQLQRVDNTGLDISYDPIDIETELKIEELLDVKTIQQYERALKSTETITNNYHINGSCVPGSDKLFVSVAGDFFPCEKTNECNLNMRIGSLKDGFDLDRIRYLMNIGYMNQERCKKCWAIRFCRMCCAHFDDGKSDLSETMFNSKCVLTQKEALKYIKAMLTTTRFEKQSG